MKQYCFIPIILLILGTLAANAHTCRYEIDEIPLTSKMANFSGGIYFITVTSRNVSTTSRYIKF